jgi:hypothetical protein
VLEDFNSWEWDEFVLEWKLVEMEASDRMILEERNSNEVFDLICWLGDHKFYASW